MPIAMKVTGLTVDPVNNTPVIILQEAEGERILPIWIGVVEASAIAFELEKIKLSRPMTHDLLRSVMEALGGAVENVLLNALKDNTYYATIVIKRDEQTIEMDARPSDAIALALRTKSPILCEAQVLTEAYAKREEASLDETELKESTADVSDDGPKPIIESANTSLADLLENLDPKSFGKYKM